MLLPEFGNLLFYSGAVLEQLILYLDVYLYTRKLKTKP